MKHLMHILLNTQNPVILTDVTSQIMNLRKINFGAYLMELRATAGYSQKKVADELGVDISLLSKIEHGERHVQSHMLKQLSVLFKFNYKELQMQFLNQITVEEYGDQPFFNEVILRMTTKTKS